MTFDSVTSHTLRHTLQWAALFVLASLVHIASASCDPVNAIGGIAKEYAKPLKPLLEMKQVQLNGTLIAYDVNISAEMEMRRAVPYSANSTEIFYLHARLCKSHSGNCCSSSKASNDTKIVLTANETCATVTTSSETTLETHVQIYRCSECSLNTTKCLRISENATTVIKMNVTRMDTQFFSNQFLSFENVRTRVESDTSSAQPVISYVDQWVNMDINAFSKPNVCPIAPITTAFLDQCASKQYAEQVLLIDRTYLVTTRLTDLSMQSFDYFDHNMVGQCSDAYNNIELVSKKAEGASALAASISLVGATCPSNEYCTLNCTLRVARVVNASAKMLRDFANGGRRLEAEAETAKTPGTVRYFSLSVRSLSVQVRDASPGLNDGGYGNATVAVDVVDASRTAARAIGQWIGVVVGVSVVGAILVTLWHRKAAAGGSVVKVVPNGSKGDNGRGNES